MKFSRGSINCESGPGPHDSSVARMRFGRNTVDRSQSVVRAPTQSDIEDGKPMDEALEKPATSLFDFRRASRAAKCCSSSPVGLPTVVMSSYAERNLDLCH